MIIAPLTSRLRVYLITKSSNNLTLIIGVDKNNEFDKSDSGKTIKKLAKS